MTTMTASKTQVRSVNVGNSDIDGGWAWVVLVTAFCSFAVISGLFYTFGVYYSVLLQEFDQTRSTTAWVGSLNGAFFQISGPVGSAVVVKLGCRAAVMIGGIVCTVGYLLSCFGSNLWHLFVSYGLVIAIGHNLVYTGLIVSVGQYFHQRHALAMGLSMAGSGCGLLALGPAIQYAIYEFGWRGSMMLNAGLTLHYLVAGSLLFPLSNKSLPTPQEVGLMGSQVLTKTRVSNAEPVWDSRLIVDAKFWCLNFSGFFWVMGGLTVFVMSKDFAVSRGLGDCYTLALVGLGIGDVIGRILGGVIASNKRVSVIFYYSLAMVACSVFILGHMIIYNVTSLVLLSILFGFSYGQQSVLLPIAPMVLYGPHKLAVIFGFLLFTAGVGTLIGPPLAGWIVDETGSYEGAYSFAGICNFLAAVCMFLVYVADRHASLRNPRPTALIDAEVPDETADKHEVNGVAVHS